jgi:membrane protease YdiL (CAAX protease family)
MLFFLLVLFPAVSIGGYFLTGYEMPELYEDPVELVFLPTLVIQWLIFLGVLLAMYRERLRFRTIGFKTPRFMDLIYAVAFLFASNAVLHLLQYALGWVGFDFSQNPELIARAAGEHIWWWAIICVTAAICEETAFRGYLMTRIRIISRGGWVIPMILASLAFGAGHFYQGLGGFIVISVYGLLFCVLFVTTGSLWPGVLAHFMQDFLAPFLLHFIDKSTG